MGNRIKNIIQTAFYVVKSVNVVTCYYHSLKYHKSYTNMNKLLVTKQSMGSTANLLNIIVTTVGEGKALK